jgi:hypothetical protein
MNRSAKDGEWSSLHSGGEGVWFHPSAPRCVRATRWGRGVGDPGRPGSVQAGGRVEIVRHPQTKGGGPQGTHTSTCSHQEVSVDRSGSAVPAQAVPGVGAGRTPHARGLRRTPRTAAVGSGAAGSTRRRGGGRPRAVLHVGNAERQRVGPESWESAVGARPHLRAADTAERRPPCPSRRSQGKKKVHALIDKV